MYVLCHSTDFQTLDLNYYTTNKQIIASPFLICEELYNKCIRV